MDSGQLQVDPLFVGLTRPATMFGIPLTAFVAEFIACALVFLAVGDIFYLLLIIPFHGVMYSISAANPGAFASMQLWMITIGRCQNAHFWGSASFSPLPTKKWVK